MDMQKQDIALLFSGWGQPAYRVTQVYDWLRRGARPEEMSNIPKMLRERLCALPWGGATILKKYNSRLDDTVKYLFALEDNALVEGVLMRYRHGNTLCISTQVGCRMGCAFCASTLEGCMRNLTHGEMYSQVSAVERDEKAAAERRAVTNIVLMGSGEPLDNYEQVITFLHRAVSPEGLSISPRNISLSTCGLVPQMKALAREAPHITLCLSLHAHSDELRDTLVPINKKYPVGMALGALADYAQDTGRRVIIEYALIDGVNASEQDAAALAQRLHGMLCHVNLIPLNAVPERELCGVSRKHAAQFLQWLTARGISATLRREMGTDIEGACGQLRRRVTEEITKACPADK